MSLTILILSFIFGATIGSFLNVVIFRYNTNLSISKGRSKCFSCGRHLTKRDLIPVFSYLMYKGRCRTCKSNISVQYPLVELLTGLMFVLITYFYFLNGAGVFIGNNIFDRADILSALVKLPFIKYLFYIFDLSVLSILICIFVYDLKHKIIPDLLVYVGAGIALLKMIISLIIFKPEMITVFSGLLSGPLVALPFALFFIVSGGRWMGFGDAKLALIFGWGLGTAYGFTAVMYSFWIGAIVVLGITLIREMLEAFSNADNNAFGKRIKFLHHKKLQYFANKIPAFKFRSEIPFGPFMIIAFYMIYFLGKNLLWWVV